MERVLKPMAQVFSGVVRRIPQREEQMMRSPLVAELLVSYCFQKALPDTSGGMEQMSDVGVLSTGQKNKINVSAVNTFFF